MSRILVTGPNGFVGRYVMQALPEAVPLPRLRGEEPEVAALVREADVIIHTAAISDTGRCEADPEASYRANVLLPLWIARAATHAKLVFFSSDQVYNGCEEEGPYREDTVRPLRVYARHKLEMEQRVLDLRPDAVLLRATWMFDPGRGWLYNLLRSDGPVTAARQYRGVTWVKEAAENAIRAASLPGGVYNFGSENPLTMAELTRETLRLLGREQPVTEGEPRHNLWMDTGKAQKAGLRFRSSPEGVRACIEEAKERDLL